MKTAKFQLLLAGAFALVASTASARTTFAGVAITQTRLLENALSMYELHHHRLPTREEGLAALADPFDGVPILTSIPLDPWGRPYVYDPTGTPRVRCSGKDGIPYTDDDRLPSQRTPVGCVSGY